MDKNQNNGLAEKAAVAMAKVKKIKTLWMVVSAIIASWFIWVPILIIILMIGGFMAFADAILNVGDKVSNFITFQGWNTSEQVFFKTLKDKYREFENYRPHENHLDIALLASTTHYGKLINTVKDDSTRDFYKVMNNELHDPNSLLAKRGGLAGALMTKKWINVCKEGTWATAFTDKIFSVVSGVGKGSKDTIVAFLDGVISSNLNIIAGRGNLFKKNILDIYAYENTGNAAALEIDAWWARKVEEARAQGTDIFNYLNVFVTKAECPDDGNHYTVSELTMVNDYEGYKNYLRNYFIPTFYLECDNCQYQSANLTDEEKSRIIEQMIDQIWNERELYQYLIEELDLYNLGAGAGCEGNYASAGNVNFDASMIQNLEVQLMQPTPGHTSGYPSDFAHDIPQTMYHSSPISLSEYIAGVVHSEIGADAPDEAIKAQAIAAKSFAIARSIKRGRIISSNGKYIMQIRNASLDQNYCPLDQKCTHNTFERSSGPYFNKNALSIEQQTKLRELVNSVANEYLSVNDSNGQAIIANADFYDSCSGTGCKNDTFYQQQAKSWAKNENLDYKAILSRAYSYNLLDVSTLTISTPTLFCPENGTGDGQIRLPLDGISADLPCDGRAGRCTSPYGPRWGKIHEGIDFGVVVGTPVYAIAPGVVTTNSFQPKGCGIYITLGHDLDGHQGYEYQSSYCHLSESMVNVGDIISGGQQIGKSGNTGNSTGPHLHLIINDPSGKKIDPLPILKDIKNGTSVFNQMIKESSGDLPYYNASDKYSGEPYCKGQTLGGAGCWAYSFSMIAAGLSSSSFTPDVVAQYICNNGIHSGGGTPQYVSTDPKVLQQFGLKVTTLFQNGSSNVAAEKEKVVAALSSGKKIILNIPNHYVVLSKIVNGKVYWLDSGRRENNGEYTIDEFYNAIYNYKNRCTTDNLCGWTGAWAYEKG